MGWSRNAAFECVNELKFARAFVCAFTYSCSAVCVCEVSVHTEHMQQNSKLFNNSTVHIMELDDVWTVSEVCR